MHKNYIYIKENIIFFGIKMIEKDQDDYELQGHRKFHGLDIDIENKAGSYRKGAGWETHMVFDYGRVRNTETGADSEEVDVYCGRFPEAKYVYQISQMKMPGFTEFDEYKYLLDFEDEEQAIYGYMIHYDDQKFFGGIKAIPVETFVKEIKKYQTKKKKETLTESLINWSIGQC